MKHLFLAVCLLTTIVLPAQRPLTIPPSGGNKKAMVGERIGITDITITYDRPGVKGREGKIWGQLVPEGLTDLGFGNTKAAPWRAGANESTTFDCSTDVMIEGHLLHKGKYGFFIQYGSEECTLIFSRNNSNWGSYYYDPNDDELRVKVKPVPTSNSVEWLKYEFTNQKENSAMVTLFWEKLSIPFTVSVDLIETQLNSFRKELRTDMGFFWLGWQTAAQWCVDHNTNLQQALQWADSSVNPRVVGDRNFASLSTRAKVLEKLGRNTEAEADWKEAMEMGTVNQVHQYARQLLAQKKFPEAFEIFNLNFKKHPDQFTAIIGLARGYSGIGDYKKALEYAQKALPLAPDTLNKTNIEKMIGLLKEGKDIN